MSHLVDLSHVIEAGMITYPGLPGPVITDHLSREASRETYAPGTEFNIGRIDMVANTGTYLDTPFHRFAHGLDLADLPLDAVAGVPGVCIHVDDQEVTPKHLSDIAGTGKAVLLHTGWDEHWGTDRYGQEDHPFVGEAAAEWLVAEGVSLVGIDSVNIDDTRGDTRPAHTRLLYAEIPIVEHLTGLGSLVGVPFRFYAVPAPVRGLGTFPVRAFAALE